jgi:hypothetical protein
MGNIGQYFRQKQASTNALEGEQIRWVKKPHKCVFISCRTLEVR